MKRSVSATARIPFGLLGAGTEYPGRSCGAVKVAVEKEMVAVRLISCPAVWIYPPLCTGHMLRP